MLAVQNSGMEDPSGTLGDCSYDSKSSLRSRICTTWKQDRMMRCPICVRFVHCHLQRPGACPALHSRLVPEAAPSTASGSEPFYACMNLRIYGPTKTNIQCTLKEVRPKPGAYS